LLRPLDFEDELLMSPGATSSPPEVSSALSHTTPRAGSQDYAELYYRVSGLVSRIVNAWHMRVVIASGSEYYGLKSLLESLSHGKRRILIASNEPGVERIAREASALGYKVRVLNTSFRKPVDCSLVKEELERGDYDVLYINHSSSWTSVLNDVECVCRVCRENNVLSIVNASSTIGAVEIRVDDWGVNALVAGVRETLNLPGGVYVLVADKRTWDCIDSESVIGLWRSFIERAAIEPPVETPPGVLKALELVLNNILSVGEDYYYRLHERASKACTSFFINTGFNLYPEKPMYKSPASTTVEPPESIPAGEIALEVEEKFNVRVGSGAHELKGRVLNVVHAGYTSRFSQLYRCLTSIAWVLASKGIVSRSRVLNALSTIIEEYEKPL